MAELPMQLLKSDSIDELKAVVLFNYSWWHARIEYSSLAHLVDDLDHVFGDLYQKILYSLFHLGCVIVTYVCFRF